MKQPEFLTDAELSVLWPHLNDQIDHGNTNQRRRAFFCATLLATGMRNTELAHLKLEGCITAPTPVIWLEKEDSKTKKHARWVGIFPPFRARFARYVEERKKFTYVYLFPGRPTCRPADRNTTYKWWKKCLQEVGITRPLGTHAARRTFATWMPHVVFETAQGPQRINSETLSMTLGHTRDVMFKHYQKPMPDRIFPGDDGPEWVELVKGEDRGPKTGEDG